MLLESSHSRQVETFIFHVARMVFKGPQEPDETGRAPRTQPRRPTKRENTRLLPKYRAARHAFLLELSQRTGRTVTCVEI